MNRLPFLILLLIILSCNQLAKPKQGVQTGIKDSVLIDTVIAPFTNSNRFEDSLQVIQERDSFYKIKPLKKFIDDYKSYGEDKLAASFIDTSQVVLSVINMRDTEIIKYDKQQMPVARKFIYRNKDLTVQLNDDCYGYCPRKFFINNKLLRPGIELDTSISGEWFIGNIVLDKENFFNVRIGNRKLFLAVGHVEECNGMACGVNYFLLYDPQHKKAIVYQQFRSAKFRAGFNRQTGEVEILVTDQGDYSDMLNCVFSFGRVFSITKNGTIKQANQKPGKPLYYKAYSTMNGVDTINIIEGNLRN